MARLRFVAMLWIGCALGCSAGGPDLNGTISVPAGSYTHGSSDIERARALELAYRFNPADVRNVAKQLRSEPKPSRIHVGAYAIMTTPVTNRDYARFTRVTGEAEPWIDSGRWATANPGQRYELVERVAWQGGHPKQGTERHPVVLVDGDQARRYCRWWGEAKGGKGDLPTAAQWERAARGDDDRVFPWGDTFEPHRAATVESRPSSPVIVGGTPGSSALGVQDMAGNVFEWTRTAATKGAWVIKGGSWRAPAVDARIAATHARPIGTRQPELGFRCVLVEAKNPRGRGEKHGAAGARGHR